MEKFFPFNTIVTISTTTRPPFTSLLREAPPLKNLSKIKTSSPQAQKSTIQQLTTDNAGFTSKSDGVFLTWKDLWVTVPDRQSGRRPTLQRLTGYAQPGEVLAIMGPAGYGKSTLLDVLAGKIYHISSYNLLCFPNLSSPPCILLDGKSKIGAEGTRKWF